MVAFRVVATNEYGHDEDDVYHVGQAGSLDATQAWDLIFKECFPETMYYGSSRMFVVLEQDICVSFDNLPDDFEFEYNKLYDIKFLYRAHTCPFAFRLLISIVFWLGMFSLTQYMFERAIHKDSNNEMLVYILKQANMLFNTAWVIIGLCFIECI